MVTRVEPRHCELDDAAEAVGGEEKAAIVWCPVNGAEALVS
jgi:hypothetical protein